MELTQKVFNELAQISGRLDVHQERANSRWDRIDEILLQIKRDQISINHLLTGNGTPEKGICVRLDRIEQDEKRRSTWIKACIGACITAIVSTIFSFIKHMTP